MASESPVGEESCKGTLSPFDLLYPASAHTGGACLLQTQETELVQCSNLGDDTQIRQWLSDCDICHTTARSRVDLDDLAG